MPREQTLCLLHSIIVLTLRDSGVINKNLVSNRGNHLSKSPRYLSLAAALKSRCCTYRRQNTETPSYQVCQESLSYHCQTRIPYVLIARFCNNIG